MASGRLAMIVCLLGICFPALAFDRAAIVAQSCGGAAGMTEAANALTNGVATASKDDAAWAATLAGAAIDRTLKCGPSPVIASSGGVLNAATLEPAASGEGSSPLLSLKNRPLFETRAPPPACFQARRRASGARRSSPSSAAPDPCLRSSSRKPPKRRPTPG
ncbi:hypothetical protein [Chenggangzhangella methanolivorans]|uniref:hypothetical protein n=1 Tax=Chenggangzhangella methanolivorans TaxID=1437009 RepID=UPI0021BDE932|nr:hypothetical protein [Chenggangzhangella methanolivorans]